MVFQRHLHSCKARFVKGNDRGEFGVGEQIIIDNATCVFIQYEQSLKARPITSYLDRMIAASMYRGRCSDMPMINKYWQSNEVDALACTYLSRLLQEVPELF